MAKADVKLEVEVTLTLSGNEAEWLITYLQNAFTPENDEDTRKREAIFTALFNAKIPR